MSEALVGALVGTLVGALVGALGALVGALVGAGACPFMHSFQPAPLEPTSADQ